jgi:hypothetical protein
VVEVLLQELIRQHTEDIFLKNYEATNEPNNQEFMKYQQIKSLYDDYFNETIKTYKKYYI